MRIAVDATPVLGQPTGIGSFVQQHLRRLGAITDLDVTGFGVTLRGRSKLRQQMAPGVTPKNLSYPAALVRNVWQRIDWPRLNGFDVVHGTNYVVPPSNAAFEVVSVHDMTPWRFPDLVTPDTARYPALVNRALNRGAMVHTISQFVADEVMDEYGIGPDRVRTVHLAFDRAAPGSARRGQSLAGGADYILAIGTIEPRKDYPGLVAAFAELRSVHPNLRLAVAGRNGWGSDAFESARNEASVRGAIQQLGYVTLEQKADLLAGARCLVFPSLYEGFGIPPLEAMAAGVPVVSTNVGSIPEVLGEAAVLVPPGEPEALAAALEAVLGDDARSAGLVEAGFKQCSKYSWDSTTAGLVDLYRSGV